MKPKRLTQKQLDRLHRKGTLKLRYSMWWRLRQLLRWLNMKDLAYVICDDKVAYRAFINGRHEYTARIKSIRISSDIKDPPSVETNTR